jgi:lipid-binding SYLF domain-containing protein
MFRSFSLALCFMLTAVSLPAQNKEQGHLENAGLVMEEILNLPDSIPQDLLNKAESVIVVPSLTKVAIGIGGSYGLQLGAQSTDLVLLVMNSRGLEALLSTKVQLGANMSAAAGPKGRDTSASTDASLRAEMLSYSRSRGLFAGVSLEGTSLRPNDDASAEIYGHKVTAREIVRGTSNAVPDAGRRLVDVLQKKAARNKSTAAR